MKFLLLFSILFSQTILAQTISGKVLNSSSKKAVEFVNIGVKGKNLGTVSGLDGSYSLQIEPEFLTDSLTFSSIGYFSVSVKIEDFIKLKNHDIELKERVYQINTVVVRPNKTKEKLLGNPTNSKVMNGGFIENLLGHELGVLMKNNNKKAYLKHLDINVSYCTYDSIFYRVNIYKINKDEVFENILEKPIYLSLSKEQVKDKIRVDLSTYDLAIEGDFLVTLEHVKNLGPGMLYLSLGFKGKSYYRKSSQGEWKDLFLGFGMSVLADVEK